MQIDLSPYEYILFDVDGTMAETEGLGHLPAFNAAFKQFSIPWHWDSQTYKELLKTTGGFERLKDYRHSIEQAGNNDAYWLPDDKLLKQVHLAKNQIYAQLMQEGVVVARTGLVWFINELTAHGKRWGVVTTTSHSNWDSLWKQVLESQISTEPAVVICGEDVQLKKPDPQAYLLAMKKLGADPGSCIAVEDSGNGLLAAGDAGIDVLVVRSQFFSDGDFSLAKVIADDFSQLSPSY